MKPSVWGRWYWPKAGRWHAIAEEAKGMVVETNERVDVVRLACGRVRVPPEKTAGRPTDDHCCPTCRQLDDLRTGYKAEKPEAEPVLAIAGGNNASRNLPLS
jgi:hypothetical protein